MSTLYQIVRSHRRTLALQIHPERGLIVRAPIIYPKFLIERFVKEKERWINKHLEKFKKRAEQKENSKKYKFEGGEVVPFLGEELRLPELKKEEVEKWYKKEALKYFTERTLVLADVLSGIVNDGRFIKHKISPTAIRVRSYRSRWGVCSRDNAITYNWRAIVFPRPVVDYLIIHELCHIVHKNHARQFYALVSKLDPDYKIHRKQLRFDGYF